LPSELVRLNQRPEGARDIYKEAMRAPFNGKRVGAKGEKRQNPAAECCATGTDLSIWTGEHTPIAPFRVSIWTCWHRVSRPAEVADEALRYGQAKDNSERIRSFSDQLSIWTGNASFGRGAGRNLRLRFE